jgi:hypothetical protein
MFRINHGYGLDKKQYKTLKGARIACRAFIKSTGVSWASIVEFRNGSPFHTFYYPSLDGKKESSNY